jgi:NADPH:quinone reductase-like Zn-dependent oxidoreductase
MRLDSGLRKPKVTRLGVDFAGTVEAVGKDVTKSRPIKALLLSPFVGQKFVMLLADLNARDLALLSDLMQSGKVTPVIDRRYPLKEAPEAIRYLETGRARGKVIITVE